jgi:predicted HTH domain antitoxin
MPLPHRYEKKRRADSTGRGQSPQLVVTPAIQQLSDMDDSITVELELPRDLLGALEVTEQELEPELKRWIALGLFREERISSGTAAELLGLSKAEFIDLLDRHGVAYFRETPEELEARMDVLRDELGDE